MINAPGLNNKMRPTSLQISQGIDNLQKYLPLEKERGSIEEGKYADFVILDRNVLACDEQAIRNVQVLKTFFEGRKCIADIQVKSGTMT